MNSTGTNLNLFRIQVRKNTPIVYMHTNTARFVTRGRQVVFCFHLKLKDKISPINLYTKMKKSVSRMKPVFHTQIVLSMAEMPRNTKMMVSDPLAKTFMTYLTVVTELSSMFELMYFWQHMPQKTILQDKNTDMSTQNEHKHSKNK